MSDIYQRKRDHIDLCNTGDVAYKEHRGLFEEVWLVHDAMPELAMGELDLSTRFMDHTLKAPLMLTGMTGGPPEAGDINRQLAKICQDTGLAFGVGSQRIITKQESVADSFAVRDVAPDVVLIGNIGINQARDMGSGAVLELMKRIEADYMAVHLNPAMELVQPGADADSDFTRGYETIGRLVEASGGKILVKECGTGIAPWILRKLSALGVRAVDLSGSGGTSWIKVEALRAQGDLAELGEEFAEWGIPTAAAVAMARLRGMPGDGSGPLIIASGGIPNGSTAAQALALGADVAGCARPALQALLQHGEEGAQRFIERLIAGVRTSMALTGCRRPAELRDVPKIIGPRLQGWIDQSARFPNVHR